MEKVNEKFNKCFEESSQYVRNELSVDKFVITDDKIKKYCYEFDNKTKKVKSELKKHAEKMKQVDLRRVSSLSLDKYKFGIIFNIEKI